MRFSVAALLALASAVYAQTADFDSIFAPAKDEIIPAGSTFKVQWSPNAKYTGKVTIALIGGADQDHQVPIATIASDVDNSANQYLWTVDSKLGDKAVYGLTITLNSDPTIFQYSNRFHIKAASGSGGSSSSGSASGSGSVSSTSAVTTETSVSSSTSTSVTVVTSSSAPGNLSTTGAPSKVTQTLTTTSSRTSSSTGTAATNTGGAAPLAAGSLALVGGLAMAVLAL